MDQSTIDLINFAGALASIIGMPLALVGIALAYVQVLKTRKASEAAQLAVSNFRDDLHQTTCLSDLTKALAGIEELKRLLRSKHYPLLPDRLSEVRHTLIAVRGTATTLTKDEQIIFQETISELRVLENKVENLSDPISPTESATKSFFKACEGISKRADSLHELMIRLRNQIGGQ